MNLNKLAALAFLMLTFIASSAFAENGEQKVNNDVVKVASQSSTGSVVTRVTTVTNVATNPNTPGVNPGGRGTFGHGWGGAQSSLTPNGQKTLASFSLNGKDLGLASGDAANNFGVWGMGTYTHMSNDKEETKYQGNVWSFMVGGDAWLTRSILVGLALGYETIDINKDFDNGDMSSDGWTVMPYAAWMITDTTVLDASVGYTGSRWKNDDGNDSGHYDADRWLGSIGLSQYYYLDNWTFSGRLGYLYVSSDQESYSLGNTNIGSDSTYLGQMSVEGKVAYLIDNFEPYVGLRYLNDVQTKEVGDNDEWEGLLGVKAYLAPQWTVTAEGKSSFGRDNYESYSGLLSLRYSF